MDPDRYEVWVAGCEGGPLWERAEAAGLRTVQLKRFKETISPLDDATVLAQLVSLIRRERFDIVHTHSAKGGFLGRLAAWLCRTPIILYTFHGFSYHDFMGAGRRGLYLLLERATRGMTDHFFAVAPRVAQEAVTMRLARPGRVTVAPSAVELDRMPHGADPSVRRRLGIEDTGPIVGTVGRLDFQKAPVDFVRMAAAVSKHHPEAHFVMVGDGHLEAEAKREARRLGVDVVFMGFQQDAPELAAAFDVFVISSLYEGLGRALTEALATGRPVVATAVNGVPDLIEPGSTGLLAPPRRPDALARCVLWLLDHPKLADRMGEAGRARVFSTFAPEQMCRTIAGVYAELLGLPEWSESEAPPAVVDLRPFEGDGARSVVDLAADGGAGEAGRSGPVPERLGEPSR
jgi:glycosyltransferase involved in cell wall biosynthesis